MSVREFYKSRWIDAMPIKTSAAVTINAPLAAAFETAAGIDARALIQKHGALPGIIHVDGQDAPWSAVGQKRRHTLSDKSCVEEELVVFVKDEYFAYRVHNFTGAFGPLVREAKGEWRFTAVDPRRTRIDWTYSFEPRELIAKPVLWFIVKCLWPGYLKAALARVKEKAEQN